MTLLNVILLIFVAIIPYLFDQAVSPFNASDVQNYASILFTFDYSGSLFIMAGFAHLIAKEEEQLAHNDQMTRFRRKRNRLTILTVSVVFSLLVPCDWLVRRSGQTPDRACTNCLILAQPDEKYSIWHMPGKSK